MIRGRKSSSAIVGCEVPVRQPSREPRKGQLEMSLELRRTGVLCIALGI